MIKTDNPPGYGLVDPLEAEEAVKVAVDVDDLVPLVVRYQVHQARVVFCGSKVQSDICTLYIKHFITIIDLYCIYHRSVIG